MEEYKVEIKGYSADNISRIIANEILAKIDIDKLKNEVKNRVITELKGDIVNSQQVQNAINNSIEKAEKNVDARINKAINTKISEIESISLENLSFKIGKE